MTTDTAKIRFNPLVALLALAPMALIGQAQAASTEVHTSTVTLAGLDLSTPEGVGAARGRLQQAARQLCSQTIGAESGHSATFVACMDDAVNDALHRIDQPGRAAIEAGAWDIQPVEVTSRHLSPSEFMSAVMVLSVAKRDLSTPAGVRAAQARVGKAARHVCSELTDSELGIDSQYSKCVQDATTAALHQISSLQMVATQDASKPRIEISDQVASK